MLAALTGGHDGLSTARALIDHLQQALQEPLDLKKARKLWAESDVEAVGEIEV